MPSSAANRLNSLSAQLVPSVTAAAAAPKVSIISRANGVGIIQINYPPVNSLHPEVQSGLKACQQELYNDASVKAIVVTGNGAFFMAGADVETVHKNQLSGKMTRQTMLAEISDANLMASTFENGPKPSVAAVNGTALGGGCELAMACNYRVAVPSAVFGQPELNLGIIPGMGGCNRYPRLIGMQAAIQTTISGKHLKAAEALKMGLIDAVVPPADLLKTACQLALDVAAGKKPRNKALYKTDKIGSVEDGMEIIKKARAQAAKKNRFVPHFNAYFDCVETGLKQGGEAGIKAEIEKIAELMVSISAKSLMHAFFASKATSKIPGIPAKPQGQIKRVAVLGAGTMGAGIAIIFLSSGYEVILKEVNESALLSGLERITEQIQRVVKSRKLPPFAVEALLRPLKAQTTYEGFDKVDLVIEAAVENLKIKQEIFAELERVCPKHCILATNTSTINIEKIAAKTNAIDRIIGLHYFVPAHVMPLLEIVKTNKTSTNVLSQALDMSKKTKKIPVVSGDCTGFIANRIFFPYGQAAGFLVDAGLDPQRIDNAIQGFGMPMGPFRMADLSGVDILVHVAGMFKESYGDRCYISQLARLLIAAGRYGQKTEKGYYEYVKGQPRYNPKAIESILVESRKAAGSLPDVSKLTDQQIVEVLFFPVVNESLRVVDEKFAYSMGDVDMASILGYGFPNWRGGVLFWAQYGAGGWKYVRDRLQYFSNQFGMVNPVLKSFFAPSDYLNRLADQ